jgi:hypothetical protein
MTIPPHVAFCGVYDYSSPAPTAQLNVWLTTLEHLAHVPPQDIIVHLIEGGDSRAIARALASRGIGFRTIERFGDGRYCNKIAQFDNDDLKCFDYVVFSDLDIAFTVGIDRWIGLGDIAAKPVDLPNPPLEMLNGLYEEAGFATRPDIVSCAPSPAATYANNCNGGLYIFRSQIIPEFGVAWKRWALWLLERPELVGAYVGNVDQISFGLAAWALQMHVVSLQLEANMPTHLDISDYPPDVSPPFVLHYHHNLAPDGTLNPVGIGPIDERIRIVNQTLRAAPRIVG